MYAAGGEVKKGTYRYHFSLATEPLILTCCCGVASHGTAMAARRCKGLMLATAALAALLAASRNRCVCCDAFITPSFRSSAAAAAAVSPGPAGRLIRHRRSAAAPADADADEDTAPGATLDASEEAAISEGGSLDVENVVVIGRCAEDLNVAPTCVFMSPYVVRRFHLPPTGRLHIRRYDRLGLDYACLLVRVTFSVHPVCES